MNNVIAESLSGHLGRQLLHWAVTQADLWYLAYRCADFVTKIHEPLERGVAVLDHLLTLEEEELPTYGQFYMEPIEENRQNLQDEYYGLYRAGKNFFYIILKKNCNLISFCKVLVPLDFYMFTNFRLI